MSGSKRRALPRGTVPRVRDEVVGMMGSTSGLRARSGSRKAAAFAVALLLIGSWLLLVAAPARAACPITDPTCLVEEITDPIVDDVEDVIGIDIVPPLIDDPPGPGEVDNIIGIVPVPAPADPVDPSEPGDPGDREAPGGSREEGSGGSKTDEIISAVPGGGAGPIFGTATEGGSDPAGAVSAASVSFDIRSPSLFDRLGGAGVVAKALAFPLVLALVVGGFLLAQNRMDRRDPRLALAPVRPDDLRFE